ncbi:YibE/F family protein [Natroniella sulfidigena]|uniref:YibE/F family protein n=1 Tax=Natroniella sulfidigena TaxID=723921 RepID=UPI00200B7BAB|nr:YibE/F family protein [Natroniella sulfidigena]MCK8817469.1 YibE/F family protein [Natroniella sulfidigena]
MFQFSKKLLLILILLSLILSIGIDNITHARDIEEQFEEYYRGKVLSVQEFVHDEYSRMIQQKAEVVITTGPHRGERITVTNNYEKGSTYLSLYLEEKQDVILVSRDTNGRVDQIQLHDVARDRGLFYLTAIFLLLLLLVGGKAGLKTIITLAFAGVIIARFMLPLLLRGYDPIFITSISAIIIIIPSLLIIGGFNEKSVAAIIGTATGVAIAGILTLWVGEVSHLTGFNSEEAMMLFNLEQDINIRGLLFAGIIVGSLGAVTDVSMSVASAISEISNSNPSLRVHSLMIGGLNVGRDIMGTMANTLLLAYVGSAIPLLLLLLGVEMHWMRIINMDIIATEFVRGITGSIGLIISIPVTAFIAAILSARKS